MTKKKQLKDSIAKAFQSGNLLFAFDNLLTLEHYEIYGLGQRNKWFENKSISDFFWNDYCIKNFDTVFSNKASETILDWYLKDLNYSNEQLNENLVKYYPKQFISSIRRTRAFLDSQFSIRLKSYQWTSKYKLVIELSEQLMHNHNALQNSIEESWDEVKELDFFELICLLTIWTDQRFFEFEKDIYPVELRRIYDYSICFLFSKKNPKKGLSNEMFRELFYKKVKEGSNQAFENLLERITNWLKFEAIILSNFCFNDEFTFSERNKSKDDISSEEKSDDANVAARYVVNERRYFKVANDEYKKLLKEVGIDKKALEIEKNEKLVHLQYLMNWKTKLILDDLQINDVAFYGEKSNYFRLIQGLTLLSISKTKNYSQLMRMELKNGGNWYNGLKYIIKNAIDKNIAVTEPFFYEKKIDYQTDFFKHVDDISEMETRNLFSHFSNSFNDKYKFNPFNISYTVMETPFVNIGKHIFVPTSFLAKNRWFYSAMQKALLIYSNKINNQESKNTSRSMEALCAKEFKLKGFEVRVCNEELEDAVDGDIDLFVSDGKTQLLIQMKRTKIKVDLATKYKEKMEVDLKGAGQINQAILSINENKELGIEIYEDPKKWIVTTSFEGLLTEVDGCLKVNYFDLLWALRHIKFNSLADLVKYIEEDRPFKDCLHYLEIQE